MAPQLQIYTRNDILPSSGSTPSSKRLFNELLEILCHAFMEDKGTKWLFTSHTPEQYKVALPIYLGVVFKGALLSDARVTVITDDDNDKAPIPNNDLGRIQAMGVLIPPHGNKTFSSLLTFVHAGMFSFPFLYHVGLRTLYKINTQLVPGFNGMTERIWPDVSQRHRHWHLLFMAARPEAQGKGYGGKILREFQRVVKEEGLKAGGEVMYLESSCARNKRLYERVGFMWKDDMVTGRLEPGKDVVVDEKTGEVYGNRTFGMVWTPE